MKHLTTGRGRSPLVTAAAAIALLIAVPWRLVATAAPVPVDDKNLVTNGGFEDGTTGWERDSLLGDASNVTISVDTDVHHSGKASLHFEKTDRTFNPVAIMRQDLDYDGHSRFVRVSLWAKADGVHKFTLTVGDDREFAVYIGDRVGAGGTVSHDWQQYKSTVKIPASSKSVRLGLEMYGAGDVWIDDVAATFTDSGDAPTDSDDSALADVKDVANEDVKLGGDAQMRYFLIGAQKVAPKGGYHLLIVLPGGDGSAAFNPFVRRIWKNALPPGYLIAQVVAPQWSEEQKNSLVWPTRKNKWQGMKFATEDLIQAVIKDASHRQTVDAAHVFTLSWSSGGPAAYSASLNLPAIKGSLVAMSVFHPGELPPLSTAKGLPYYLLQSPDDKVTPFEQAQTAQKALTDAGAKTTLETYAGGHGWRGDVYGNIRRGIEWLEKNSG